MGYGVGPAASSALARRPPAKLSSRHYSSGLLTNPRGDSSFVKSAALTPKSAMPRALHGHPAANFTRTQIGKP
jgi:hypothetical protein